MGLPVVKNGNWNAHQRTRVIAGGRAIRDTRASKQWTVEELAQRSKISLGKLQMCERGERAIERGEGLRLMDCFGITPEEFNELVGYEVVPSPKTLYGVLGEADPFPAEPLIPTPWQEKIQEETQRSSYVVGVAEGKHVDQAKVVHMHEFEPDAPPALPRFDLNEFVGAYQQVSGELESLRKALQHHGHVSVVEGSIVAAAIKALSDNTNEIKRLHELNAMLQREHETKGKQSGVEILRNVHDLLGDEIKRIEAGK
jgi:transcriptional regulator with XRE-family HTH domain